MLISDQNNFIFIHIHKAAGTSISHALSPFVMSPWRWRLHHLLLRTGLHFPTHKSLRFNSHITAAELIDVIGFEQYSAFFSFAFVRNPWDLEVSLYKYMCKLKTHYMHELVTSMGGFDEYIEWRCKRVTRYQKDFVYSPENKKVVDFVGKYESLHDDFSHVCSQIGITASLPLLNQSNTMPYQSYYTDTTKELIRNAFEQDIRLFDYKF